MKVKKKATIQHNISKIRPARPKRNTRTWGVNTNKVSIGSDADNDYKSYYEIFHLSKNYFCSHFFYKSQTNAVLFKFKEL